MAICPVCGFEEYVVGVACPDCGFTETPPWVEDPVVSVSAGEGNSFVFTRSGDASAATSATYDVGGSASPGTDYVPLGGTVGFAESQSEVVVNLEVYGANPGEFTVEVALTGAGEGYTISAESYAAAVTFVVDPPPPPVDPPGVWVERVSDTTEGGDPGLFRVLRTEPWDGDLVVEYASGGTAELSTHYLPLPGSVTIPHGEGHADVPVTALPDGVPGPTRTVTLTPYPAPNGEYEALDGDTLSIFDGDGEVIRWVSTESTDFLDPVNWDLGRVPVETDRVVVAGETAPIDNFGAGLARVSALYVGGGYEGAAALTGPLSVGTLAVSSGTVGQWVEGADLTVTDCLLWVGGAIGGAGAVADLVLSGASGEIANPDPYGTSHCGGALRLAAGAAVRLAQGSLSFGRDGLFLAGASRMEVIVTTVDNDVRLESSGGAQLPGYPAVVVGPDSKFVVRRRPATPERYVHRIILGMDFSYIRPGSPPGGIVRVVVKVPVEVRGGLFEIRRVMCRVEGRRAPDQPSILFAPEDGHTPVLLAQLAAGFDAEYGTVAEGAHCRLLRTADKTAKAQYGNPDAYEFVAKGDFHLRAGSTMWVVRDSWDGNGVVFWAQHQFVWAGQWLPYFDLPPVEGAFGETDRIECQQTLHVYPTATLVPNFPNILAAAQGNVWEPAAGVDGLAGAAVPVPVEWPEGFWSAVVPLTGNSKALRVTR